ncbi:MAG: S26 family signal peptidase [Gemmatimonadaceae bacterium]|nr:S26 family signal peptidase [Chitinophagaceae bacterium]
MTFDQIFVIAFISFLLYILPVLGVYKMFLKAGTQGWKAFIPIYNTWEMLRLAERPKHWVFWQFLPIVGWFVTFGIYIEFVKTFGKFKFYQHALTVFSAGLYFIYVGFNQKDRFLGAAAARAHKKSPAREWIDAGVFAIVAATLIRIFIFEAYTIPTGSMEKTLLVNDFLFVGKFNYGPRIPNTPIAMPFVHHTLPFTNSKSYVEWAKIPYTRWFASPVERNDVVVFNFPAGDTVINRDEFQSKDPYYDVAWRLGNGDMNIGRKVIADDPESYPLIVRPVDKQENYIKRCVAIAGDSLQIIDGILYINGKPGVVPPQAQLYYDVVTKGQRLDEDVLKEEYGFTKLEEEIFPQGQPNHFIMLITNEGKDKMIKNGFIDSIKVHKEKRSDLFPRDGVHIWQIDDFGPLWVPKKGAVLTLTPENYALYERVIRVYENNKFEARGEKFFVNDKEAAEYMFKMDYYWMMGDNRHGSQDSRFWGFVPEDHVVGEAWLIWMSWDGGVRWKRMFSRIH